MSAIPHLIGPAPNEITWVTFRGVDQLSGRLRPPYSDNRGLAPPLQIWDLIMHMFDEARHHFASRNPKYIFRMGFGVAGANRYQLSIRGSLNTNPDPVQFLGRIESLIDSNDSLDVRDIRLVLDFIP
jgi:hypothetical protein